MILPSSVAFASPDALKAEEAISFVALTQAEHALDFYVDHGDILSETGCTGGLLKVRKPFQTYIKSP